jgi:hypothetical protein
MSIAAGQGSSRFLERPGLSIVVHRLGCQIGCQVKGWPQPLADGILGRSVIHVARKRAMQPADQGALLQTVVAT